MQSGEAEACHDVVLELRASLRILDMRGVSHWFIYLQPFSSC